MARRPLEKEGLYLDGGRRTTQLMRDSLGSMSTDLTQFAMLTLLGLAGYSAGATAIARGRARRYLPAIATVVAAVTVAGVLAPAYIHRELHWLTYKGDLIVRDVAAYVAAACILMIPAIIVTTKLAVHFATAASSAIRSWALTWGASAAVLLLSSFLALAAAIWISGEGP